MRGQLKQPKSLKLTGNVWLKYEDEEAIETADAGDIMLYQNTDASPRHFIKGNYYQTGQSGYLRADIFDGKEWQILDITDFCEHKEHYFSKTECPIDVFYRCKDLLSLSAGVVVYRGYRGGHYSTYLHEPNPFKGRKGHQPPKKK